jgi:hypothetical protein
VHPVLLICLWFPHIRKASWGHVVSEFGPEDIAANAKVIQGRMAIRVGKDPLVELTHLKNRDTFEERHLPVVWGKFAQIGCL